MYLYYARVNKKDDEILVVALWPNRAPSEQRQAIGQNFAEQGNGDIENWPKLSFR